MRSVTRWMGRRWCWARHRGELWKKHSAPAEPRAMVLPDLRPLVDDFTVVTMAPDFGGPSRTG